ncbi:hypothetical protein AZI86_06885 [Bdellovibrio bacteriovorus]|uniref:Uncharacterized protein n=1 Tax=Bdellovibrio bacteriovorus TaxID=959 RepID=A0A150WQK2_BDEBC|nr:hypothetical protein [Bdellovibrio bacteriovorus]KYG66762.1 hypothetical protein AZI86_06885 [Bdellovibrio bacteriovorus]
MKMMLVLLVLVGGSPFAWANDLFYKPTDKITFTYEEFRKLSPEHQAQWIQELRNFNRNVDLIIDGQRLTAKKPKYWSFIENLNLKLKPANAGFCALTSAMLGPMEATAQDKSCFLRKYVRNQQPVVCVICKTNGLEILNKCALNDRKNPSNTANGILAEINSKESKDAKLTIGAELLTEQVDKINKEGHASIETKYLAPNPQAISGDKKPAGTESTTTVEKFPVAVKGDRVVKSTKTETIVTPPVVTSTDEKRELTADAIRASYERQAAAKAAITEKAASVSTERKETVTTAKGPRLPRAKQLGGTGKAEACQVSRRVTAGVREICMICPGDAVSGAKVCTAENSDSNKVAKNLISGFSKKDYEGSKVNIDEKSLTELVAVTKGEAADVSTETRNRLGIKGELSEGAVNFEAPILRRRVITETVTTGAAPLPVTKILPDNTVVDSKSVVEPGPLSTIEKRDENNKVIERVSNDPKVENFRRRNLQDVGDRDGNESIDTDELTRTDRLACIYAGWAVENVSKCSPISERSINDPSGKKITYSCKRDGQTSESTIYGSNEDGSTSVLCNPVIFGLLEGKPICIKTAKNATEICASLAPKADQALDFAKQNPKEYRSLTRRVELLCQSDVDKLREHFVKRGKPASQINNSIKDLSTTCQHLRTRMAQLMEANNNASPDAGTR